ncbi:phage tail protein [Rubritalea marina]|uniref:phage tail protein n=1 Tax=Rubritalea marina TaxID=361055 RepID=UPI00037E4B50|nr:tail fiber protein [Rubritalea marina]
MSDPLIGEIKLFAGTFAPRNWAFCAGQILPINQYQSLYSIIGSIYGGDGRSTFGLPDLRSRVPVHASSGSVPGRTPYPLGAAGGVETVTLLPTEIPAHNHQAAADTSQLGINVDTSGLDVAVDTSGMGAKVAVSTEDADRRNPSGGILSQAPGYSTETPDGELGGVSLTGSASGTISGTATASASGNLPVAIGNTGGSGAHENRQPFLALNYIIALEGIYPPRS